MIINNLEMYNFRQYIGKQSVDFSTDPDKNVTVLIGINTSGKTTIIRAFEWCLYGKNGFEDQVLLNSEVRNNMNPGDVQETYVAVKFTYDGRIHTLKRSFKYTCTERTVKDGKVEVSLKKTPEENLIIYRAMVKQKLLSIVPILLKLWTGLYRKIYLTIFSLAVKEFLVLRIERTCQKPFVV